MIVGTLEVQLHFPSPQSLKEKRMLLKSLVTRLRGRFNIAVAEVEGMDLWQSTTLAIVTAAKDKRFVNTVLSQALDFIGSDRNVNIVNQSMEIW